MSEASPQAISASAPGKLMLAGEYSVLRPGGMAVALSVQRHLEVRMRRSHEDRVTASALGLHDAPLDTDPRLAFVAAALEEVRQGLGAEGGLHCTTGGSLSEPDPASGAKLGLGSSAAVTVATVAAALQLLTGSQPRKSDVFRLAHSAHSRAQGKLGSGYDVASQTYGGLIVYRPPRASSLGQPQRPSNRPLHAEWPECAIDTLPWPVGLHMVACHSGTGAETVSMVERARRANAEFPAEYERLLDAMASATQGLADSLRAGDVDRALNGFSQADAALRAWDARFGLGVWTPPLEEMARVASQAGAVSRVSGAGGGDCMLLFADDPGRLEHAASQLKELGFAIPALALDALGVQLEAHPSE